MSAQRRTATRRETAATGSPPRGTVTAARTGPASAPTERPARSAERGKAAPARAGFDARLDGVKRVYRDTAAEMKKINWPDRETTKNLTLVVIGISLTLGLLLGGIDLVLRTLFEALP